MMRENSNSKSQDEDSAYFTLEVNIPTISLIMNENLTQGINPLVGQQPIKFSLMNLVER
jgi:hypothetical protein